jgi:diguanylate cyclase (GGDEF)-like protein/PAS domain S-box-containing protein
MRAGMWRRAQLAGGGPGAAQGRIGAMLECEAGQADCDTVAGTWAPAIGDAALSPLERLIRSAAFAADCESAVFLTVSDGVAAVAALFDAGGCLPLPTAWWQSADALIPPEGILVIEDLAAASSGLGLSPDAAARFVAALRVCRGDGATCGVLLVADRRPHPGLSPAQTYVLTTHGLQLSACKQTQARAATGCARREASNTERLRLLESVVVHANDAVLITEAEPIDLPGPRIVYCNAAFTKTTGYTEAEVLGRTPRILQSSHVDRPALDRLRRALQAWEPVEVELLNVHKDGTEFWVELSIVPVADETGWFTHWVSVQRDVTGRKQAEEVALRARIAEVENRALEAEIAERKRTEERLLYAAFHDDLTRLRNRAYLMDRLAELIGQPGGAPAGCAVLFLDLDRFKLVNDSLGHRAGDLLLMEVSRRLAACVRPGDVLARVGGDEFAVLVAGAGKNGAEMEVAVRVAGCIIEALRQPIKLGQHDVFSQCSIGIAVATDQHETPEQLLRDADIAMYGAKKRGPGGYAIFNDSMRADVVKALALQTDLRQAVARREFRLQYQPIYGTASGALLGVEALVRWHHPVRGLVSPASFIPMAEEVGLIRDIGRWVLREACSQLRAWQAAYMPGAAGPAASLRVSVNVSADELRDRAFIPELRAVLRTTGLDPGCLQLEITESVFLHHPETVGRVLKRIRALGVRVALDDFGTGYSSLGYLDRYRIDTLKIDRSFIARMLRQRRAMAIMEGIVRLGRSLDLDIVAEGVETPAQLRTLRGMGCASVQGFLLGRPMPPGDLAAILDRAASALPPAVAA